MGSQIPFQDDSNLQDLSDTGYYVKGSEGDSCFQMTAKDSGVKSQTPSVCEIGSFDASESVAEQAIVMGPLSSLRLSSEQCLDYLQQPNGLY